MPENDEKQEPLIYSPHVLLDTFDQEESGHICQYDKILPAFDRNNVAICIVSSDEYAPFASVVIQSIICNATSENNYDIVLLSDDMLMSNRWRIECQAKGHDNISIRIVDISKIVKGLDFYTWAHFTSKTYYRLLTPDVFNAYDKVIYLDSDIVVNHDIAELYQTDLQGYFLAAAYDTHVVAYCTQTPPLEQREYNKQTLKMENPEQYFQTGVTLFNIKTIRENYKSGYFLKEGLAHKLRWLDQDLLNMLCYGKIKRLPNKWNVMIANETPYVDEYYLPAELRKEYFEARQNPYIIHFIGRAVPCYTDKPDLYEYYWKYARQTVFYEIIVQRMAMDYVLKQMQILRDDIELGRRTESFKHKFKRLVRSITDVILPKGSKRRIRVKNVLFRFKNIEKWYLSE
jgi:lipopolysaccharide biosynthesis glycosyltransferase